jgi:hypothetical protein
MRRHIARIPLGQDWVRGTYNVFAIQRAVLEQTPEGAFDSQFESVDSTYLSPPRNECVCYRFVFPHQTAYSIYTGNV